MQGMHRRHFNQWLAAAGLAGGLPALADTGAALPVQRFFNRPQFASASLSPSGDFVAIRHARPGERTRLVVLDLSTMKLTPVASYADADIYQVRWVSDRRLVFNIYEGSKPPADQDAALGLYAVDVDGERYRQLVDRIGGARYGTDISRLPWNTFLLDSLPEPGNDEVLVGQAVNTTGKLVRQIRVLRVNTVNGQTHEVELPPRTVSVHAGPGRQVRAALTLDDQGSDLLWRESAEQPWRSLRRDELWDPSFRFDWIAPDGRCYVSSTAHTDTRAVYRYDPQRNVLDDKPLLAVEGFDIDARYISGERGLLGLQFTADAAVSVWFDEGMKALQARVDALLPATSNLLDPPRHGDSPWVLVQAFSDQSAPRHYVYQRHTDKLRALGAAHPELSTAQMASTEFLRFKARDGRSIPAYLSWPAAQAKDGPLPLAVLVHGGPMARDVWGWNPEVQFLASRGYAVLQVQFRGSTGFGRAHYHAGWKQWGMAMQDDVEDGVRWAIAERHVDAERVAILGASYGGYAALMGLIRTPTLYRCAVEWCGVTDLDLLRRASWSDMSTLWRRDGMSRIVGDPVADAQMLREHSPVLLAERIQRPLLMASGQVDQRVPIEHAERMRAALGARAEQLEWLVYPKEGHGWSQVETQIDFWSRVERFLARHMGPRQG